MVNRLLLLLLIVPSLAFAGECKLVQKICSEGAEARVIDGFKVYRDCWGYENIYKCSGFSFNSCEALRESNCEQISSQCKEKKGEWCVNHEKSFRCIKTKGYKRKETRYKLPTFEDKNFDNRKHVACGEQIRCLDGKCFRQTYDVNNELAEAVAMLRAMQQMQKKFTEDPITVFKGSHEYCRKKAFGLNNCCKSSTSWTEKAHLSSCKSEEKSLAEKKNKSQCIYVGESKKKKLGITEYKQHNYCCFDSTIVKVIQEEGRKQLGRSYGASESPDCSGMRVDELQKIDFSKIDFSPIFGDIISSIKPVEIARVKGTLENELRLIKDSLGSNSKVEGQNKKYNEEGIL